MVGNRKRKLTHEPASIRSKRVERMDSISDFSSDSDKGCKPIKKPRYFREDDFEDPIVDDSSDVYEEMSPVNIGMYDNLDEEEVVIPCSSESEEDFEDIECIPSALKKPLFILNEDRSSNECLSSNEERLSSSEERLASSKEVSPLEGIRQDLSSPDLSGSSNAHRNSQVAPTSMTMFFSKNKDVEKLGSHYFPENAARHSATQNKG